MFERIAASEESHIFLLFVEDVACGYCFFSKSRDDDLPDEMEIVAIYLLESYWGRGFGKRLMGFALSEIRRLGYESVFLWVLEENRRARRFYETCGFIADGADGAIEDSGLGGAKVMRYRSGKLGIHGC